MAEYYERVSPAKATMFFSQKMLEEIHANLKLQIISKEKAHLESGQGFYIYDKASISSHNNINIGVHVRWKYDLTTHSFNVFNIVSYHLFTGDIPNEILDAINELASSNSDKTDKAEWKIHNN